MIQCSGVCDLKLMIFKVTYSSTLLVMHAYMSQIFKLVVYMPHTNQQSTCHTQISSLHATHKLVVYMPHTNQQFTCRTQISSLHATHKLVVYMPHTKQQFTCHTQISSLHATQKLVVYMPHTNQQFTCHTQISSLYATHNFLFTCHKQIKSTNVDLFIGTCIQIQLTPDYRTFINVLYLVYYMYSYRYIFHIDKVLFNKKQTSDTFCSH